MELIKPSGAGTSDRDPKTPTVGEHDAAVLLSYARDPEFSRVAEYGRAELTRHVIQTLASRRRGASTSQTDQRSPAFAMGVDSARQSERADVEPAAPASDLDARSRQRDEGARWSRWLARVAGANEETLQEGPSERPRFVATGAMMVTTALIAALAGTFAAATVLPLPPLSSVLVGLMWALIVFNVDRTIAAIAVKPRGLWRNVLVAAPRVALAIVMAAVISVPVLLRIFQPELDSEVQLMGAERTTTLYSQVDERFAEQESRIAVQADFEVRALQSQVDELEREYREAQDRVICETDGTCGSGVAGVGSVVRASAMERDQLSAELAVTREALARATDEALARAQDEVQQLRNERAEQRMLVAEAATSDGLSVRLEALNRLTEKDQAVRLLGWALFILLLTVDMLPMVAKLLGNLGPATLYDQLLARREHSEYDNRAASSQRKAEIATEQADVRLSLERAQLDAARHANTALVAAQTEVAEKAIAIWKESAMNRSDDELVDWYKNEYPKGPSLGPLLSAHATPAAVDTPR